MMRKLADFLVPIFYFLSIHIVYAEGINVEEADAGDISPFIRVAAPKDDLLAMRLSLRRKFNDINDLIAKLNSLPGVMAKLASVSDIKAAPIFVVVDNGTLKDVLDQSAAKLGYTWQLKDKQIIFGAINSSINAVNSTIFAASNSSNAGYSLADGNHSLAAIDRSWQLSPKDKTLRNALSSWCRKTGWQLIWNVNADYAITVNWVVAGDFESAVNEVLKASQGLELPLMAVMHENNKVLEVYSPIAKS